MTQSSVKKLAILAMMIALDVVLSPLFRIEGMAPMSSVVNVVAAAMMGPLYATIMAFGCALIRMALLGIPPLALTGAIFGALLAGLGYRFGKHIWWAAAGEILGTGLIGSLLSYPVMVHRQRAIALLVRLHPTFFWWIDLRVVNRLVCPI